MPASPSIQQIPEVAATMPSRPFVGAMVVDMSFLVCSRWGQLCEDTACISTQDATVFYTGNPKEIPSYASKGIRRYYAGQILSAVFDRICSSTLLGSLSPRKSSRFCLMSGTPGPGQSVPNRVLPA